MSFFGRFLKSGEKKLADSLYREIVVRAREPVFYHRLAVPDTVEGRFDMVVLHAFLVLRRLKADRDATRTLAQALFDRMFVDMDENLREMGIGDLAVGPRVKKMAKAFYGRVAVYEAALAENGPDRLAEALRRNLYRDAAGLESGPVLVMARYVRDQAAALDARTLDGFLGGGAVFAPIAIADEFEDES